MPITLVLADDHPLVLDGLEALISSQPDMQVVARCTDGRSALAEVRAHHPDVLLLDLRMPRMDGLAMLRELKKHAGHTRVIVLTAALGSEDVIEATRLGVRGVVLKDMAPAMLLQCIRRVHEGGLWLERSSTAGAVDVMLRREDAERELARLLTPREVDVVRLIAQGMHNKDIARSLDLSEGTVKLHLHNAYRKLGIDGRLALSVYLREIGLA